LFSIIPIFSVFIFFYVHLRFATARKLSRHEELMHEKEENERKELEKAMMIFMMNRSARILQKYQQNQLNIIKMYEMTFFLLLFLFFVSDIGVIW
jgi:hypothetical protein